MFGFHVICKEASSESSRAKSIKIEVEGKIYRDSIVSNFEISDVPEFFQSFGSSFPAYELNVGSRATRNNLDVFDHVGDVVFVKQLPDHWNHSSFWNSMNSQGRAANCKHKNTIN